ncbi:MAG: metallophosphoesterase family protein [bacterium]
MIAFNNRSFKLIVIALMVSCSLSITVAAQNKSEPDRIILNLTETPATSQAVTWRTNEAVASPQAQIEPATELNEVGKNAVTVNAITETVTIHTGATVYSHSVVFKSLSPDILYEYRVGDGENWSEWNQFRTASGSFTPFRFIFLGDPQNDLKSICSRIFRAAYTKAPDARFWLLTGDIVNVGDADDLWGEFYYALGWIPRMTPMILVPGNHEYKKISSAPPKIEANKPISLEQKGLTSLWRPQFTLPENGLKGLEESVYYIDYQGVRFIMLNGTERLEEQAKWLKKVLEKDPQRWTIVSIHQPFYSTGEDRDNPYHRQLFVKLFDKYNVDLVLQGHDHTYGRTYKLRNGSKVEGNEKGTIYVVSVSGPKTYDVNKRFESIMAKSGTNRQLFQVINVDMNILKYESYTATGELFDSFKIEK